VRLILWECVVGLVPVTVLTVATLGVILAGITTATEAAALGALGAILLVVAYGRFTWSGILGACHATLSTTSMVLFLAVASNIFGAVFARLGTATWITNALLAVPLPAWGTMSLVLVLIFLLGWPFEWPAIVLIFLPMLAPVATGLGYDMVWFATITAVVLQTAFLSPPVAMSAYYQAGGEAVEPRHDLPRHGGLHGDPGALRSADPGFPGYRDVAPAMASRGGSPGGSCLRESRGSRIARGRRPVQNAGVSGMRDAKLLSVHGE
jgi:TRAP-type mannitol/chloroaromatic compound transport system permease large subunit